VFCEHSVEAETVEVFSTVSCVTGLMTLVYLQHCVNKAIGKCGCFVDVHLFEILDLVGLAYIYDLCFVQHTHTYTGQACVLVVIIVIQCICCVALCDNNWHILPFLTCHTIHFQHFILRFILCALFCCDILVVNGQNLLCDVVQ